jgi:arsenate reductase (thioredoxin)
MSLRILILCTGNSCRSQMAEGILKSLDPTLQVFSAGISPASRISSKTIAVMKEININLDSAYPKHVHQFLGESFDYVITVCDHAKETCPVFIGNVKHRLHLGFEDPTGVQGTDEEIIAAFRRTRDEIKTAFSDLYFKTILKESIS